MTKTFASIFSGGEGAGFGAMQAGLTPLWGVECEAEVARVAETNVPSKMIVMRAQDVDYSQLESPSWLHMSPQCKNASQAKQDGEESEEDITQARAGARAVSILQPETVSLENVWGYRNFESFRLICNELIRQGYQFNFWHLNFANYGVPQTRKRLILLASRHHRPQRPRATHSNKPQGGLFDGLLRWVGWYEAIEDLIPTLPESEFAEWQFKRLQAMGTQMIGGGNTNANIIDSLSRAPETQAFTVATNALQNTRAFIAHPNADNEWFVTRDESEPVFTIKANNNGIPRAFIVGGKPASYAGELQIIEGGSPVVTITASQARHPFRAWLSQGKVVSMTPRALARFQSIPDSYILPESNSLACKVIGNAVSPLAMRCFVESELCAVRGDD